MVIFDHFNILEQMVLGTTISNQIFIRPCKICFLTNPIILGYNQETHKTKVLGFMVGLQLSRYAELGNKNDDLVLRERVAACTCTKCLPGCGEE